MAQDQLTTTAPVPSDIPAPRTLTQAQAAFAAWLPDPQEQAQAAATFTRLAANIAGPRATPEAHAALAQTFFRRITHNEATGQERPDDAKADALRQTLTALRDASRTAHASPSAARAHLDVESFSPATDDLQALYTTPDHTSRAAHAGHLHRVNPEARDLYEHGATLYEDTLVIPRETHHEPPSDQIRLGSLTHAVKTFTPLLGATEARTPAQEFVTLGRDIAGRTADGDTHLAVFREFYRQIQRDDAGRWRTPSEQAAQLPVVLENMRELAEAMRAQEWTPEPAPTLALEDWERGFELRQRAAEHERQGPLSRVWDDSATLSEDESHRPQSPVLAPDSPAEHEAQRSGPAIGYERIALRELPPRLPAGLTREQDERLRYEVLPSLDRQIESGLPPADIYRQLAAQTAAATQRAQEHAALHRLNAHASDVASAPRIATARALYTLQTLGVVEPAVIAAHNFSTAERAAALDTVGRRLAQDYRGQVAQLNQFAALEQQREQLQQQAIGYAAARRETPAFQQLLAHSQTQTGAARALTRRHLADQVISPEIDRQQTANAAQLEALQQTLRHTTGHESHTAQEARAALTPDLRRMRAALNQLAAERATLPIARPPAPDKHPNPLYIGTPQTHGLRLAVGNRQEYQTLLEVAAQVKAPVQFYPDRTSPALDGHSETRQQVSGFVREYVAYRLRDPDTRLLNSHRLFREFNTRLDEARTPTELRQTVAAIRQENYARAHYPERFAEENAAARASGAQVRRPLNEGELRRLLLAPAPAHYTPEMQAWRIDYLTQSRDKATHLRGLAEGRVAPSPALQTLLQEFTRTQNADPHRQDRNIRAFLGDYLNPPDAQRNRFSRHNLYELRTQLGPAERDYLYQTIEQTRHGQAAPAHQRQPELTPRQEPEQTASRLLQESDKVVPRPPQPLPDAPRTTELHRQASQRVADYLVATVRAAGPTALQDPAQQKHHATQVQRLLNDTLQEQGYAQTAAQQAPQLQAAAQRLVAGLPTALTAQARQPEAHTLAPPPAAAPERTAQALPSQTDAVAPRRDSEHTAPRPDVAKIPVATPRASRVLVR